MPVIRLVCLHPVEGTRRRSWISSRESEADEDAEDRSDGGGRPGILGPIAVDFSQATNVQQNLADGTFSVELTNEHMVKTSQAGEGLVGVATMGCVIPSPSLGSQTPVKYSTIAGLARLARDGELYFNLHTTGQTYFGDIRGQLHPAGS